MRKKRINASSNPLEFRRKHMVTSICAIDEPPTMKVNIRPFRDRNTEGVTIILTETNPKLRQKVMAEIMDTVKHLLGEEKK